MKTAFDKLPLIYGKHKTCRRPFEKQMYKFNKQQINNELRPNDFKKGVFITQKKAKDAPRRAIWIFQQMFAKRV